MNAGKFARVFIRRCKVSSVVRVAKSSPQTPWRGSLLSLGGAAVVNPGHGVGLMKRGAAPQPNGDKSPRHKGRDSYEIFRRPGGAIDFRNGTRSAKNLWERACSRCRRHSQHHRKLALRFREQARSHSWIGVRQKRQVGYKAASLRFLILGTPSLGEVPSGGARAFCLLLTGPASGLLKSEPL